MTASVAGSTETASLTEVTATISALLVVINIYSFIYIRPTRMKKQNHFYVLGVFILMDIIFTSLFYINGSKLGLSIVLLSQILYVVMLLFLKVRNDNSVSLKMCIIESYVYFIVVFWAVISFLRGVEYGWKWSLLAAVIVGSTVGFLFFRHFHDTNSLM